jgi:hypothetical protein
LDFASQGIEELLQLTVAHTRLEPPYIRARINYSLILGLVLAAWPPSGRIPPLEGRPVHELGAFDVAADFRV